MIGPSSGANNLPNRQVVENPVRKRKLFEELDIDSFCEEICQSTKKCHSIEQNPIDVSQVVNESQFSTAPVQEISNNGSVARLEVLVVDGTWDVSSLGGADLIDLSSSLSSNSTVQNITDVQNIESNYGTILSYWEPTVEETGGTSHQEAVSTHQTTNIGTSMSCGQAEDQENGNLSWLLDFKLDSLIEAPEEKPSAPLPRNNYTGAKSRNSVTNRAEPNSMYLNEIRSNYNDTDPSRNHQTPTNSYASDNRNFSASRYGGPKKPPFTYTELIEHALQERGELTVSAIYQWISEHFPYYKSNDDRWKNSVRHNLSINPHFRKGSKAPHGAGHLWAIANRGDCRPRPLNPINNLPITKPLLKNVPDNNYGRKSNNAVRQNVVIDEVAAATASITQSTEENVIGSVTLEHCAEQILSGIKREVEVQYLMPMAVQCNGDDTNQQTEQNCDDKETERDCWNVLADFLNPVAKEVVAEECGLIGEGYLVTDINPATLGLNMMAEPEIITPDHLFGEELSFQFYELTSSSQIQSA